MDDGRALSCSSKTAKFKPKIMVVPNRLKSKAAIITGAARGIGRGIAERFAQEGAAVVVPDIDVDAARDTCEYVKSHGVRAFSIETDVSDGRAVQRAVEFTVRQLGGIDILVNNAGMIVFGSMIACRPEDWDRMIEVDLTGAFLFAQAAAKQMISQGRGGRLIHIGSTASLLPAPQQFAYSVAKAGLVMLSRAAALELVSHGITSNVLCPHGAVTDINRDLLSDPDVMSKLESRIPAGRLSTVEEIAAAVAFLASDEAEYITGTEFIHDGGASISGLWWR
jgi:NAD(P)-dependent dehydrogenase (short-subunit alcohol dehydrogenase family)